MRKAEDQLLNNTAPLRVLGLLNTAYPAYRTAYTMATTATVHTHASYPMPASFSSLEEVRAYMIRHRPSTWSSALWDYVSEINNNSFVLYGEYEMSNGFTAPFSVQVSYANNMLEYTPLTTGRPSLTRYIRDSFIPRVHPRA